MRVLSQAFVLFAVAGLCIGCFGQRAASEVDPAKRDWYGEFYNLREYDACVLKTNDPRNTQCEYLRLVRTEEPEYWPNPNVPKPKLPEPPSPPVYRPGMTSEEYFKALCEKEAGEFIYRTVENVEGLYQIRPRKLATWDELFDRYVMEDPYGYTRRDAENPETLFVRGKFGGYRFFEARAFHRKLPDYDSSRYDPSISTAPPPGARVERYFGYDGQESKSMKKEYGTQPRSRYGFVWRGIKRPMDRELGIAGGELIALDLSTGEILGIRRGFARSGFVRNSRSGIQWETAAVCPRLRTEPSGWDKTPEFTRWFLEKVLRPAK